jgi:hypothetical protein
MDFLGIDPLTEWELPLLAGLVTVSHLSGFKNAPSILVPPRSTPASYFDMTSDLPLERDDVTA